ncbi:hypothetical protein [Burkholderia dolosa]|jgi:hypothetical protein|uniref:hypothetical protein n=1 Tax=Burkholderia dolosa TaxID=152500 RepID=UPI002013A6DC|nr:hypothetical protein [Burkholderia dolosa]MDN7424184.1 hypothetical protein [Burkholderia dolosa]
MLSPHEFATLMLIRHSPDQLDMSRAELDTLLERQLVMLEHAAGGARRAHLTPRGRLLLDAFDPARGRAASRKHGMQVDGVARGGDMPPAAHAGSAITESTP